MDLKNVSESVAQGSETMERTILDIMLPTELKLIFKFLRNCDLFAVRLVCKTFKEAASDRQVFRLDLGEKYLEVEDFRSEPLLSLLNNVVRFNIYNFTDDAAVSELFQKLEHRCPNVCHLSMSRGIIPSDVSLQPIASRLSHLNLMALEFKNASHFFKASPDDRVYCNLRFVSLYLCSFSKDCAPFEGISIDPMTNLRQLHLNNLTGFGGREFEHLKGSLANVTELQLHDMQVDSETFEQLNLAKLITLNMYRCRVSDDLLSTIGRVTDELEELSLSDIAIRDTGTEATFVKLKKLKRVQMYLCDFDNELMAAIGSHLSDLTYWEMNPRSLDVVGDDALRGLTILPHLECIHFDCVQLTGWSLRQIARSAPALARLTLKSCSAEDEDMEVFDDCFTRLVDLSITGLRITNVGLLKLEPRLRSLERLELESWFVTKEGLAWLVPFLNAAKSVDIAFGEPRSSFHYDGTWDDDCQLHLNGQEISEELIVTVTSQFRDIATLRLENLSISATEVQLISKTQPKVKDMTMNGCIFDESAAAVVFERFPSLRSFYALRCHLTDGVILSLMKGIDGKQIEDIHIENEKMPNDDTIRKIVPLLASVSVFNLQADGNSQQMYVSKGEKDVLFVGMDQVSDETVVTTAKLFKEMTYLALVDTAATADGIAEIAPVLDSVDYLRLGSKILGDETMKTIGSNFPNLRTLYMECDRVTDDGFVSLGKHLQSLECLSVIRSQVTDEGIKKIAPQLTSVTTLDVYRENVNVTKELIAYMKKEYPKIAHYEPAKTAVPAVEEPEEQELD